MSMTINREMFREIHELITAFPKLHLQTAWETNPEYTGNCGTTRCIAGWATWIAARDAGLLTRKRQMTDGKVRSDLANALGLTEGDLDHEDYLGDYPINSHPVLGAKLLGLTDEQAQSLFHDMKKDRAAARVKSFAETGEDISAEEYLSFER